MAIFPAFISLAKAIDRHLLPTLDGLGFREIEREPEWWGGHITYDRQGVELRLAYETHDAGLIVRLGKTKLGNPGPDYRLYTAAAGIGSDDFQEASGGWRPRFQLSDFEKTFAFVATTLPTILPRQAALQQEIEEQQHAAERERQRLERNARRRASRKRPT